MPYPNAPLTNARLHRTVSAWLAGLSIASALMAVGGAAAQAQTQPRPAVEAAPQAVPGFWDPRRRPDRPDLSRLTVIRFLTETTIRRSISPAPAANPPASTAIRRPPRAGRSKATAPGRSAGSRT